jgi:hypothetical protein
MSTSENAASRFPGAVAKYVTYNTLPDTQVGRLAELFRAERPRRLVLVSGLSVEDHQYLLDAAAYHTTRSGVPTRVGRVPLGAFEPDRQTPAQYLEQLLEQFASADTERNQRMREAASILGEELKLELSFGLAGALSLVSSMGPAAMVKLARLWRREGEELQGPPAGRAEHFHTLLRRLTRRRQLVLFLPDLETLPDTFLGELTHLYKHNRRLILAFGCADAADTEVGAWAERVTARVALAPHDRRSLEVVLAQRFPEQRLPRGVAELLVQASGGSPWILAGMLQRLVAADVLVPAARPWWALAGPRMDARTEAALATILPLVSRDRERIDALRVSRDRLDHAVRELVLRASLCGPAAPLELVAGTVTAVRAEHVTAADVVKALDARFGDGAPEARDVLLRRCHARRAAFPADVAVYEFRDELTRWAVAALPSDRERRAWARELLAEADARLAPSTRGIARLLLELARVSGDEEALAHWQWRLSWWVSVQEAEELRQSLVEGLRNGTVDAEPLWDIALSHQDGMHPRIRLALLDALETNGVPWELVAHFHSWRGGMHQELECASAAFRDLRQALAACPEGEESFRWNVLSQLCTACKHLRNGREGERYGMQALELAERFAAGDADHRLMMSQLHLCDHFFNAEDRERAAVHARAAWKHAQALLDAGELAEHDRLYVVTELTLARCTATGAERRSVAERVAARTAHHHGDEHLLTLLAASELASVLNQQGHHAAAEEMGAELLERCRRILSENHYYAVIAMSNLASLREARGDLEGACAFLERVIEIRRNQESMDTAEMLRLTSNLARVICKLGDPDRARPMAERALQQLRADRGNYSRFTLAAAANLAVVHQEQGKDAAADALLLQVRNAMRLKPTPEHSFVLAALRDLALSVYRHGRTERAMALQEQLVLDHERLRGIDHPTTVQARERLHEWRGEHAAG